jgi:hypothetical protein
MRHFDAKATVGSINSPNGHSIEKAAQEEIA